MKLGFRLMLCGIAAVAVGAGPLGPAPLHATATNRPAWADNPRISAAASNLVAIRAGQFAPNSAAGNHGHACKAEPSPSGNVQVNCVAEDAGSAQNTQSETSVAAFGKKVVVGYNDSLVCCTALNLSGYSVSTDGGKTFTDEGDLPWFANVQPLGDPALAVDDAGNFYYASLAAAGTSATADSLLSVYKMNAGTNHFHLLSVPVNVGTSAQFFADKEYLAVSRDSRGQLHFHLSWTYFNGAVPYSPIMLSESTDGFNWTTNRLADAKTCDQASNPVPAGDTLYVSWEMAQPVACAFGNPNPAALEVMATVNLRTGKRTNLALISPIAGSGDAIVACNSPQDLREVIEAGPGQEARTFELPSTTRDANGTLYAVWQDRPNGLGGAASNATEIFLSYSVDGNHTWSRPQKISGANATLFWADRWQPWVTTDAAGVHAMWYQRVAGGLVQTDKEDLTLATPTSAPTSAAGEQMLSTVAFPIPQTNPNQDPIISNCYMGDYNNIVSVGGVRYVTWGDNRNIEPAAGLGPENQPDVFLQSY